MKYGSANNICFATLFVLLLTTFASSLAAVDIAGPRSACEGESIELTAPAGYRSYRWSTGEVRASVTVRQSGRYGLFVVDASGIADSGFVDVVFHPLPRPRIGNPREYICRGQSATLSASDGYASYRWNTGETTRQILVSTTGWYHLMVVDTNGCVGSSDSIFLTVVDNPDPVLTGPTEICNVGVRTYAVQAPAGSVIQWTVGGLGTIVGPSNNTSVTVDWTGSGLVEVRVSVPRPDGEYCTTSRQVMVRMSSRLRPPLDFTRRNLCLGERTVLRVSGQFARYRWSDGSTADSLVVDQFGLYWAEVEDDAGCLGISDSVLVRVHPPPVITVAGATFLCRDEQTVLTATAGGNDVVQWEWSTGARTASISVAAPGTFTVTGTTINGCRASVTHVVRAGRYPSRNEFTQFHDLGVIDLGTSVDALLDTVDASLTILGLRLVSMNAADGSRGQLRIVDGDSIPGTEIWFRMNPQAEGQYRAVVRVAVRDECLDSIDIEVTFTVVRRLVTSAIHIAIPDTTVDVGTILSLPCRISVPSNGQREFVDIDLLLHWDASVFRGQRITGATTLALATVGRQQFAIIRVPQFNLGLGHVATFTIEGITLLAPTTFTSVVVDSVNIIGNEQYDVTTQDGSVSTESCWVAGRLVRFGVSYAFSVSVSHRGGVLSIEAESFPSDEIAATLYTSDGRELLNHRCTIRTDAEGRGRCSINVSDIATGIYLIRAQSMNGQRTLPVLIAP